MSKLIKRGRALISSALKVRRVIAGDEIKAFKNENGILKGVSCVTVFNKNEVFEICNKLKVGCKVKQEIERYFSPDMGLIKNTKRWEQLKNSNKMLVKGIKEYIEKLNNVKKSVAELESIKIQLMSYCSYSKFVMDELEK